jgi:hypothetical protein
MKTILSIPLIILILFSGISVHFDTHFCGGNVAATKVSFNGELATCGMEQPSDKIILEDIFTNNCCDDLTSAFTINNNYISSSFNIKDPALQVICIITVPIIVSTGQELLVNSLNNEIRPPGTFFPHSVSLPALCTFRI